MSSPFPGKVREHVEPQRSNWRRSGKASSSFSGCCLMAVGRSLAWMGGAQAIGVALQFGAQVVLIRILTLQEAGIYAVALAVVGVLALLQSLGLQAFIVREEVLTEEIQKTAFTVNALLSVVIALGTLAIGYGGAAFLGDPGVRRVLVVVALTPIINIFSFLPAAVLEREGRFREIAIATTAGVIAAAVTTVVLALLGFSYMSAAYSQWASAGVTTVLMVVYGREHARLAVGFASWRRVADFGLQMLAISGISNLGMRVSDILLARMLGLSALGLYSRASGLNALVWTNLHLLVGRVMLVDYAELYRQGVPLRQRYISTVDMLTALLWPVFAGFAVLAGPFIETVYGERWVPAARPLAILALASMILVAITMTYELFAVTGRLRVQTKIEFIRSVFALATFAGGCLIGLEAAAAARVLDALFAMILYRPQLNRMTDTSMRDFVPIYARSTFLTVMAVAPAAAFMTYFGWAADVPLLPLGLTVVAGITLWAIGLRLTRHPLLAHFMQWRRRRG